MRRTQDEHRDVFVLESIGKGGKIDSVSPTLAVEGHRHEAPPRLLDRIDHGRVGGRQESDPVAGLTRCTGTGEQPRDYPRHHRNPARIDRPAVTHGLPHLNRREQRRRRTRISQDRTLEVLAQPPRNLRGGQKIEIRRRQWRDPRGDVSSAFTHKLPFHGPRPRAVHERFKVICGRVGHCAYLSYVIVGWDALSIVAASLHGSGIYDRSHAVFPPDLLRCAVL